MSQDTDKGSIDLIKKHIREHMILLESDMQSMCIGDQELYQGLISSYVLDTYLLNKYGDFDYLMEHMITLQDRFEDLDKKFEPEPNGFLKEYIVTGHCIECIQKVVDGSLP